MSRLLLTLAGLAICYFPSYVGPLTRLLNIDTGLSGPPSIIVWNGLAVAALLAFVLLVERRPLASLLITRPSGKDIETALFYWGIAMAWTWLATTLWPPLEDPGTASLLALSIPVLLAMVIATAITEEILFRAYPIERLNALTATQWIGPLASFIIFLVPI